MASENQAGLKCRRSVSVNGGVLTSWFSLCALTRTWLKQDSSQARLILSCKEKEIILYLYLYILYILCFLWSFCQIQCDPILETCDSPKIFKYWTAVMIDIILCALIVFFLFTCMAIISLMEECIHNVVWKMCVHQILCPQYVSQYQGFSNDIGI